jgi:hypothetical protein
MYIPNLANKICFKYIMMSPMIINKKPPSINRENMERSDILRTDAHPYKGGDMLKHGSRRGK